MIRQTTAHGIRGKRRGAFWCLSLELADLGGARLKQRLAGLSCVAFMFALICIGAARADGSYPGDPDQGAKSATDVNVLLRNVAPETFQLVVQNQSSIGYIDSFAWVPGPGWTLIAITKTVGGKCTISPDGGIACEGKISPPKTCTCLPGGQMKITFKMKPPPDPRATRSTGKMVIGTGGSYFIIKTMTAVPRHIPTELRTPGV
jgi:hypothetical protein